MSADNWTKCPKCVARIMDNYKKGKENIDSNTHSWRQISVVSGYRRNPIHQNGVVRKSGKKTQNKRLFRAFF